MNSGDAFKRAEGDVEDLVERVEKESHKVWHDATTPNRCPVCNGDRVPCPDPRCLELGEKCPTCHGREVICQHCDAEAWAKFAPEIAAQTAVAARIVSAEDNDISMI